MSVADAPHDPTSVVSDLLRGPVVESSYNSVRRPIDPYISPVVPERALQISPSAPDVLVVGALVALAHFSGSRALCVGVSCGKAGATASETQRVLSIELEEQDTLRTLTARIASWAMAEPDAAQKPSDGSADPRCTLSVRQEAPEPDSAPLFTAGEFQELHLEFGVGMRSGHLTVHYAEQSYEASTAEQLADHVLDVLDALLADPDRPVTEAMRPSREEALGLLTGQEPDPQPGDLFMPGDLVRSWVARTPEAVAVLAADGTWLTYGELGSAADLLAGRLADERGSGTPVAILTSDSRTGAIAMVACQFADRCWVVLDPEVPTTRNTALLTTAGCGVLLHDEAAKSHAFALAAATGMDTVAYEDAELGRHPITPTPPRTADGSPAYIAFTSGTTGAPKGVVQSRRSFAQFIAWQQAQINLGPGSRVAMWSAPVFDACYMEVFGALAYGATLCVPPLGERRNPEAVAEWLTSARVTFFQGIPSFIEYVVAALEARSRPLPDLENVIVAGEVFPPALSTRMRTVFPSARLHNMFGPTECVLATRYEIPPGHSENRRLPIGRPITGRRILLTDAEGRPVPRGAVGEIGIVSRFLSSGYIGDEALTSSRFRPVGNDTDEVIYHTGDFGRIGSDGSLRYLGRRDAQVKVRGIRVNLDEIEAVLSVQPQVGRCKVVDVRVAAGHVQLVAFVQPGPDSEPLSADCALADRASAAAWRSSVTEVLGTGAAPTRFIVVKEFPRTATGKPDLGRMRWIDEELRSARPTAAAAGSTRERVRRVAQTVVGRPVRDDEDLLASADDPLLLALRLKKALLSHCPGAFEGVDVRVHSTIDALEDAAAHAGAASRADA